MIGRLRGILAEVGEEDALIEHYGGGPAGAETLSYAIAEVIARRAVDQAAIRLGEAAEVPALIKAALQDLGR